MTIRQGAPAFAVLALWSLPGCFDSIVGAECKAGYSPCHGTCVPGGTCKEVDGGGPSGFDGSPGETWTSGEAGAIDAAGLEVSEGSDATAEAPGVDGEPSATLDSPLVTPDSEPIETAVADSEPPATVADGGSADAASDATGVPGIEDALLLADTQQNDDVTSQDDVPSSPDVALILSVDAEGSLDGQGIDGDCEAWVDGGSTEAGLSPVDGGAAEDGATDGSSAQNDADAVDDSDGSADSAGPLVCTDPQIMCNDQCVNPTLDPENCGGCANICESGVCIDGSCLVCASEQSVCGRQCVNLAIDPDNCGRCGVSCMNGLCSSGQCQAAGTGRAIVIGHDYLNNRPAMNRVLGNAVFLWPQNPVRLLVYEGSANPAAIAGADGAIAQVAAATGRQSVRTSAPADGVTSALASADVFLIYGQESATDDTLAQLGKDWKAALSLFVQSGGTVIVLDGNYLTNSGTVQILSQASDDGQPKIFDLARDVSTTGGVCTVIALGDALATGLPRTYLCERNSTSFLVSDAATTITSVVADDGHTVVLDKIF